MSPSDLPLEEWLQQGKDDRDTDVENKLPDDDEGLLEPALDPNPPMH